MPSRKQTDAERVMRYVASADVTEVRHTLRLARVVVEAREGEKPKRAPRLKVTIPPNEDEA